MSVKRGDGSREAAIEFERLSHFQEGRAAFAAGEVCDADAARDWIDGWCSAADDLRQMAVSRELATAAHDALMAGYAALRAAPEHRKPTMQMRMQRQQALVDMTVAIAKLQPFLKTED